MKAMLLTLVLVGYWMLYGCGERAHNPIDLEHPDINGDISYEDISVDILEPTYFTESLVKLKDELVFVKVKDRTSGEIKNFFAIGYDSHSNGPWDGVSGKNQCYRDAKGKAHGFYDNAEELNLLAAESGANFVYVWSGEEKLSTSPKLYGRWLEQYNNMDPKVWRSIPIIYNGAGEVDMDPNRDEAINSLRERFRRFKFRIGEYSREMQPLMPSYEEMPWFSWHPTWRIIGTGDGRGEMTSDEQADAFAQSTTMMIGDNYTYVENRFDEELNPITGQKGKKGEDYDYWLSIDDPDHRSYFSAAWDMIYSARRRSLGDKAADPSVGTVVWAWIQGHAFNDDIGRSICFNGTSGLWAAGKFPTKEYLRKEITSTIAAGGTGIIFFGYFYCRRPEADVIRSFFKALSNPEIYEGVLISPEMDLGYDTKFLGEVGYDGRGRAHIMVKWYKKNKTIYLIGSNPGARATTFSLNFPFSIEKAYLYNWDAAEFFETEEIRIHDRKVTYTIPRDDGVIIKLKPLHKSR
ncbi:MAG: hypothetical protein N2746_06745 [Deltaproteobacteria bacterium]|nr:hypothetical protein [Deltaproteobacteria bacterium]